MRKKIMILSVAMLTLGSAFGAEFTDPTVGVSISTLSAETQRLIDVLGGELKVRGLLADDEEAATAYFLLASLDVPNSAVDLDAIIAEIRAHFSTK